MTIRTITNDNRYNFLSASCGLDTTTGTYYQKQQNGTNTIPRLVYRPGRKKPKKIFSHQSNNYTMTAVTRVSVECLRRLKPPFGNADDPFVSASSGACAGFESPPPSQPFTSNDTLSMMSKLSVKIRGSDFNLAVTLGESKESLDLIGSSAVKIARALSLTRHGHIVAAANVLTGTLGKNRHGGAARNAGHSLTSSWLELQYGWMPLLKDVYSASQALAYNLNRPRVMKHRVGKTRSFSNNGAVPFLYTVDSNTLQLRKQIIAEISEGPPNLPAELGLTDPLSLAWELLPYSFVVDWFYPIGQYLDVRNQYQALIGTFVTSEMSIHKSRGLSSGDVYEYLYGFAAANLETSLARVVSSALDPPLPNFTPFSDALSWKRCISGLSLLNNFTGAR